MYPFGLGITNIFLRVHYVKIFFPKHFDIINPEPMTLTLDNITIISFHKQTGGLEESMQEAGSHQESQDSTWHSGLLSF